jgi:hypothetical protein
MIFAYILTKTRHLRLKIVGNRQSGTFKKKNFEYNINRERIYTKKFLWKTVFWCMYFEGNPNPIFFDEKNKTIDISDVPIDEIAILMNRILKNTLMIVMLILIAFNFLLTVALLLKVYGYVS